MNNADRMVRCPRAGQWLRLRFWAMRRLRRLALLVVVLPASGCASGRGNAGPWMAGMMGVMVLGGAVLGTGMMHGRAVKQDPQTLAFFAPARLLARRDELELTPAQIAALEALAAEYVAGRRTGEDVAIAARELLRPVQRAAVGRLPEPHDSTGH